jgi:PAS domain S-box-containing protein
MTERHNNLSGKIRVLLYLLLLCFFTFAAGCLLYLNVKKHQTESLLRELHKSQFVIQAIEFKLYHSNDSIKNIEKELRTLQTCIKQVAIKTDLDLFPAEVKKAIEDLYVSFADSKQNSVHIIYKVKSSSSNNFDKAFIPDITEGIEKVLSTIEADNINATSFMKVSGLTCFLCFFAMYCGAPAYHYFQYKKPLAVLASNIHHTADGKGVFNLIENTNPVIAKLALEVQNLVVVHQRSRDFIENISSGKLNVSYEGDAGDNFSKSLSLMQDKLRSLSEKEQDNAWINDNLQNIERILKTESDAAILSNQVITLISRSISAGVGILYGFNDQDSSGTFFYPLSAFGSNKKSDDNRKVYLGEGQLGEMGMQRKTVVLSDLPKGYLLVESGLGSSSATEIVMMPFIFKNNLYGALEVAGFSSFSNRSMKLLERVCESLAAHYFNQKINDDARQKLEALTDKQANELVEIHRLQQQTYSNLELKLREVEDEKFKNQAILEGCVDGVLSFDERGEINFCNHAACEIFGYERKAMLQKRVFELVPVRIDIENKNLKSYYLSAGGEKEITVRTEAIVKNDKGESIDVLITTTQVEVQHKVVFTFFLQKISVDLF